MINTVLGWCQVVRYTRWILFQLQSHLSAFPFLAARCSTVHRKLSDGAVAIADVVVEDRPAVLGCEIGVLGLDSRLFLAVS